MNLAIHVGFANAAGDQLGDLGTEIEDEDFLVLHGKKKTATDKAKKAVRRDGLLGADDQSAR